MKIAEIYLSIQGEGVLTGTESVFVRTSGCNLRCWFCDTPFTSWEPEGDDYSPDEVVSEIERHACNHVVITGGEPLLWAEMAPLCRRLREQGRHITIETAGTLYQDLECDLMSISPKLANSTPPKRHSPRWHARHERTRHAPQVVAQLMRQYEYQLKFVIDQPADCREVLAYLDELPGVDRSAVLLMPQAVDAAGQAEKARWLKPYCQEHGLSYCPRRQIEWFGLVRGT